MIMQEVDVFPLVEARSERAASLTQRLRADHAKMRAS